MEALKILAAKYSTTNSSTTYVKVKTRVNIHVSILLLLDCYTVHKASKWKHSISYLEQQNIARPTLVLQKSSH